jgi:hypothetical protein
MSGELKTKLEAKLKKQIKLFIVHKNVNAFSFMYIHYAFIFKFLNTQNLKINYENLAIKFNLCHLNL